MVKFSSVSPLSAACLLASLLLAGCSGASGLTTGALFGSEDAAKAKAQVAKAPQDTPIKRAYQLGKVSARAVRCGYNFDKEALKSKFLQNESLTGLPVEQISKLNQVHDSAFRGVARAVAKQEDYCTSAKTKIIKASLNRYLAGDFTSDVVRRKTVAKTGAFDWFDTPAEKNKGPKFGSIDWWAAQDQKIQ
ncbi:MAG: hypothetical protein ACRBCJ_01270 [Hyphomicrobiaceae bacterium]